MIRVIKRYESRKLYDTEESRYVSLEDISMWVREGQEIKVLDNATSDDVTPQVLTQIILDEGKRGTSFLPTELLHELVRAGERAFHTGVEQVQSKVDTFVQRSIDRLAPVRQAREEMATLRQQLGELESTLIKLETQTTETAPKPRTRAKAKPRTAKAAPKAPAKKASPKAVAKKVTASARTSAKATSTKKAAAKKEASKKEASKKEATKTTARKTTARKTTTKAKTATKKVAATPKTADATVN